MGYANMWKFRKRNLLFDFVGGLLYIGLAYPLLTRCWNDELALPFNTPSQSYVCGASNELSDACLWWRVCGGLVFESLMEIPKVTFYLICNELLFDNFLGLAMMWFIAFMLVDTQKTVLKFVVGTMHATVHVFCAVFVAVFVHWVLLALNTAGRGDTPMWSGNSTIDGQWIEFGNENPSLRVVIETTGTYVFQYILYSSISVRAFLCTA